MVSPMSSRRKPGSISTVSSGFCRDDKERFEAKLKRIAKAKPTPSRAGSQNERKQEKAMVPKVIITVAAVLFAIGGSPPSADVGVGYGFFRFMSHD